MSGLDLAQVRTLWVGPALTAVGLWSKPAEDLVLGTGLVESGYSYLKQVGGGPALSPWQIEKATHDDIWANYLHFRPSLAGLVSHHGSTAADLVARPLYAAIICRLKYLRAPEKLPTTAEEMALYHKKYYNTQSGKASVERNIPLFKQAIG